MLNRWIASVLEVGGAEETVIYREHFCQALLRLTIVEADVVLEEARTCDGHDY